MGTWKFIILFSTFVFEMFHNKMLKQEEREGGREKDVEQRKRKEGKRKMYPFRLIQAIYKCL